MANRVQAAGSVPSTSALLVIFLGVLLGACSSSEGGPEAVIAIDNPNVKVGTLVALHGAESAPGDGAALTYRWTLVETPSGSAVALSDDAAIRQVFTPDVAGSYRVELVARSDAGLSSAPASVEIVATDVMTNAAPYARIIAPAEAPLLSTLTLDGASSRDAERDPLSYRWELRSRPAGSVIQLASADAVRVDLTPDVEGVYEVALVVDDGVDVSAEALVAIRATSSNAGPTLRGEPAIHAFVGQVHELRPSVSDPEGDGVELAWRVLSSPAGSVAEVSLEPRGEKAENHYTFRPDVAGDYAIEVVGTDGAGNVARAGMLLVAEPASGDPHPVAVVGPDQVVILGDTVTLDGHRSYDALDHATLVYDWHFSAAPAGSTFTGGTLSGPAPGFDPDLEGEYVIQLVVSDGAVSSAPASAHVRVNAPHADPSLYDQLRAMGLDATDAQHLEANHRAEAEAVVADNDRLFGDLVLQDTFFVPASDPATAAFLPYGPVIDWTPSARERFRKVFGRINFAVNSARFRQAFDAQVALLNPAYQGLPPTWEPYPASYQAFEDHINQALADGGNVLTLVLSTAASGIAYGVPPLSLRVETGMMGQSSVVAGQVKDGWSPNGAAPLVFHELTHSFGYDHSGTGAQVTSKPNNIPYFVQIILGYQVDDILGQYCQGSPLCTAPFYLKGAPNSLLTYFFGSEP